IETYNLGLEPFTAFLMIIPANYYALMALLISFLTIYWRFDFPLMKKHEQQAMQELEKEIEIADKPKTSFADAADLLVPILVLIISTIIAILISGGFFTSYTGINETTGEGNIVMSLVYDGIFKNITADIKQRLKI